MNEALINQGRASAASINVRNAATVSLAKKTPVVFAMNGTEDGFAVVRPSDASANQSNGLFAGLLLQDLAIGAVGAAAVKGIVDDVPYIVRRRAGTTGTDVWASEAAITLGQGFSVETILNMLETVSATHEAHLPMVAAGETVATIDTGATTTATAGFGTKSVSTGSVKVFLRVM